MADPHPRGRSPLIPLVVVALAVVIGLAIWFWAEDEVPRVEPAQTENGLARDRPAGAGTQPEAPGDPLVGTEPSDPVLGPTTPSE